MIVSMAPRCFARAFSLIWSFDLPMKTKNAQRLSNRCFAASQNLTDLFCGFPLGTPLLKLGKSCCALGLLEVSHCCAP